MKFHHLQILAPLLLAPVSPAAVNIDYVNIGNAGNPNDPSTGYGFVPYNYQISRNETTISQYAEFLNVKARTDPYGLYNTGMATDAHSAGITRSGSSGNYTYSVLSGAGNRPITYVSWFDAARFTNWLHNGQGNGSTETGAYTLGGATSGIFTKNVNATVWLPSENEWYKAAYYDPTPGAGGGDNYWRYATQSDALINNTVSANYIDGDYAVTQSPTGSSSQNYLTNLGAYGTASDSFYGTNDQTGNVLEWNDAVISGTQRGRRGGAWSTVLNQQSALTRDFGVPTTEVSVVGFRVASVPEPTSVVLTILFSTGLILLRKR